MAFQYSQVIQQVRYDDPGRQTNAHLSYQATHQGIMCRSCFLKIRLSISLSSEVDMMNECVGSLRRNVIRSPLEMALCMGYISGPIKSVGQDNALHSKIMIGQIFRR